MVPQSPRLLFVGQRLLPGLSVAAILAAAALSAQAADPSQQSPPPQQTPKQPTAGQYVKHIAGPEAVVFAGAGAGITQATNTPHEWGQGAEGFGKRFGSALAKHAVKSAIAFPVAKLRHEVLGYERSTDTRFRPRLEHALLATVYTRKTTTGAKTVNTHEIAGAIGSGLISRLWQPASVRSVGFGFMSAGITIGVDAGTNVLREFWPDIRHRLHHDEAFAPAASQPPPPQQQANLNVKPWPYF